MASNLMPTDGASSRRPKPYYSYLEEVLVGRNDDDENPGHRLPRTGPLPPTAVTVRFESAATLTIHRPPGPSKGACDAVEDDSPSSDSALPLPPNKRRATAATRLPISPFPLPLSRLLLESYPDLTRLWVVANHRASDSYPTSPLDAVPTLLHGSRSENTATSTRTYESWRNDGGPSGISLHAEFILPKLQEDATSPDETLRRRQRLLLEDRFEALARELHNLRILLAPASLARSRTTLRKQPRPVLWGNSMPSNTTNANATIVTLSLVWPTEASIFSSEGMEAFLQWLPCHEGSARVKAAGIWSLASPHNWSQLLLGTAPPPPLQHRPMNRRLWMEATVSNDCRGSGNSNGESASSCRLTWSQGVEFAVVTKDLAPSTNASLRQLLPFAAARSNDDNDHLVTCPFADATQITTAVVRQSHHRGAEDDNAATTTTTPDEESSATSVPVLSLHTTSLPSQSSLTEPFLHLEELQTASGSLVPDVARSPRWQVEWRLLHRHQQHRQHRRHGLSQRRDALRAALRNRDLHCRARVEFRHTLPLVLEPDWTSIVLVLRRLPANNDDPHSSNSTNSVLHLAWKEFEERHLDVVQDASFGPVLEWSFQYELPPASELELRLEYDPAFLSFETFPADPNRGFEVPPFSVTFAAQAECESPSYPPEAGAALLHSSSVLLLTPVPDLSMPFNVLSLTCTLYALIIGAIFNLALRRASERVKYTLNPELEPPSWKQRLKERLAMLRQALHKRLYRTSRPALDEASETPPVQGAPEDLAAAADVSTAPEEAQNAHLTES